jgi:dTDP-4-amino-4,6-dideoxygalactose transaminase
MDMSSTKFPADPPIVMNSLKRLYGPCRAGLEAAAARVIASGWTILGPEVEAFERSWADYVGVDHCVGVASGSDALQLALRALDMAPGDEVLTVANAGGYATQAILAVGARPVFVDIDPLTHLLDAAAITSAVSARSRALIVTHLYGRMADMPVVLDACRRHGLAVVEDAAQAHGASWAGRRAGSWGDAGCFSFYPTKNLGALGDAGAVCCSDPAVDAKLRRLRQYGWQPKYQVSMPGGMNSRMDEMQAAFLGVLLPRLEEGNAARRRVAAFYADELAGLDGFSAPARPPAALDVAHLCVHAHPARDRLREALAGHGVHSDIHYPVPDYLQPGFIARVAQLALPALPSRGALPHSEAACDAVFSLPCHPFLDDAEMRRVVAAVRSAW